MNNSIPISGYRSEEEQTNQRKRIKEIMSDPHLSQQEKSRAVHSLMDGRRRQLSSSSNHSIDCSNHSGSHYANNMARAAAQAHEYYSSDDDEGDAIMSDTASVAEDLSYGYDPPDARSAASSVTADGANAGDVTIKQSYREFHGRSHSLQDWNDTDRAAAAANTSFFEGHPAHISRLMETSRPICEHYDRNCTIISACCGLAFGCRICHDDCPVLPKPLYARKPTANNDTVFAERMDDLKKHKSTMERRRSMPLDFAEEEENHHTIDRFAIREVLCRSCYTRQSSKS
jgi:hypothetical protein